MYSLFSKIRKQYPNNFKFARMYFKLMRQLIRVLRNSDDSARTNHMQSCLFFATARIFSNVIRSSYFEIKPKGEKAFLNVLCITCLQIEHFSVLYSSLLLHLLAAIYYVKACDLLQINSCAL